MQRLKERIVFKDESDLNETVIQRFGAICDQISMTDEPITAICKELQLSYWYVDKAAKIDQTCREVLGDAKMTRAIRYAERATEVIANCSETMSSSVAKAKAQAENYLKWAASLAPEMFGDYIYELRQIKSEMRQLQDLSMRLQKDVDVGKMQLSNRLN